LQENAIIFAPLRNLYSSDHRKIAQPGALPYDA
jgi:hypothetical protein